MNIDKMLEELQAEWGQVYVAYYGPDYYDGMQCTIRNVTDEGLPVRTDPIDVDGSTFTEALEKAHRTYVND